MARKSKKAKKSRSPRSNPVVEALTAVSGELNGINERLNTVQENVETLRGEVSEVKTTTSSLKTDAAPAAPANTDALDALVKTQQVEAAKRLREEVLPEARRAQRFYGYLTLSVNGGEFKMEKIESVSRLEEVLKGVEDGTIRILMNPFAAQPTAHVEKVSEVTQALKATETPKRGLLQRLLDLGK